MLSPGFFNQPDHLQIPSDPGTYALILKNISHKKVQIGKWGQIQLKPGFYIYVGSAFGSGGLKARLSRHLRIKKTKRWHIDYLRDFVSPYSVWYSYDSDHLEHRWALAICNINGMVPIKGFGSSDCKCIAHLFWTLNEPNFSEFLNMICGRVDLFAC